jgi:hypothetical protein
LKTSIQDLQKEIFIDAEYQIQAKVHIIFMSSSGYTFALLDPTNLPTSNVAIDVWIIRGQNVILTQHYKHDAGLNWQFQKFIEALTTRFQQTISVETQDFNQILVLRNQQFSFVNIDSDDMYLCKNTTNLAHIATLFSQIIEQETSFLDELNSFHLMLQQANIVTTTTEKPIAKRSIIRTNSSILNSKSVFVVDIPFKHKVSATIQDSDFHKAVKKIKRSLADIFTPYSVTSIGDTANSNYKKMNKNFNSIHVTESKLAHAQIALFENFESLQTNEIDLLQKEIFLELRTLKESSLNSFIFDLQQILSTNHLDKSYDIVFSLLRKSEFCFQSLCYSLPIFSSIDKTLVAVTVQSTQQSLAKGYYISCTILANHRTSIYSHKLAIFEDDLLHFKQEGLPSISFSDLKRPNIDLLTRPIDAEDKLVNQFYPIYNGMKVSLQCLKPLNIIVDSEKMWCDDKSLQFIDFPQEITIDGKTILSVHVPQHFSMKMAQMTHDFEIMSKFQPMNSTDPHLVQEIVSYFEVAETIHWSLFTLVIVLSLCILVLICFCSYLKCPNVMRQIFSCCCAQTCCLLKCFSTRVREREVLRSQEDQNVPEESTQMISMSNQRPIQTQIENVSPTMNNAVFIPSAPNMSVDSNMSSAHVISSVMNVQPTHIQPLAASTRVNQTAYVSDCRSGYQSCFCNNGQNPCRGPIRQPPFQ